MRDDKKGTYPYKSVPGTIPNIIPIFHLTTPREKMSHGSATIKDIAKALGISKSTVSRALSEHTDVNSETRKRILEFAHKLDYQPNMLALNLKQQRTRTIGVIIPETENRFFAKATSGIQRVANLAGYNVMICQSDESYITERNNLRSLIASHVDGILISIASETDRADHFDLPLQKNIPVVFFDRIWEDLDTSHVFSNNYEIAFDGTAHLIGQGCKRIAVIAGPQHLHNSKNRLNGYIDALKKHGLTVNENYIIMSQFRGGNVEEYTRRLLGLPERPDAVFAINDYAAVEMMHILKKNGIKIPMEIAVLGINNDIIGQYVEPSLSTIDLSVYEMASAAAELLLNKIKDRGYPVQKKLIKAHLIIRDSTDRLSVR